MSKVITFSRTFPAYHPRKGEPTYFVEKFTKSLLSQGNRPVDINCDFDEEMYYLCDPKYHTIRAGQRFKIGDKFSPRVWSGKPYQSKQIIIAPDTEIKKIWNFSKDLISPDFYINGIRLQEPHFMHSIAANDGLSLNDLLAWFKYPKPFSGQIICWNENINY